jgi:DnaK suppressor protein
MPTSNQEVRVELLRRVGEIEQALAQACDNAAVVELDQSTNGRLTRMDAMQQAAMASAHRARLETDKRKYLAAIDRVDQLEYGLCCRCGEFIASARLANDPATPFCVDCARD